MAVPAAFTSMTSSVDFKALMTTAVSSQSDKFVAHALRR